MSDIQPTDDEMATARLLYATLRTPPGTRPPLPEWERVVTLGNGEFKEWYREAVLEAVAAYGGDPTLIEVKYVRRPPMAGPLISDFFVNLDPTLQTVLLSVAASAIWDGFKRGYHLIYASLAKKLAEAGIPEESLVLRFSAAELEDLCVAYVREHFHPRAKLSPPVRATFNTAFASGYAFPIDQTLPMGWEIRVSTASVTYTFVVDSLARILALERQQGGQCMKLEATTLLSMQGPIQALDEDGVALRAR